MEEASRENRVLQGAIPGGGTGSPQGPATLGGDEGTMLVPVPVPRGSSDRCRRTERCAAASHLDPTPSPAGTAPSPVSPRSPRGRLEKPGAGGAGTPPPRSAAVSPALQAGAGGGGGARGGTERRGGAARGLGRVKHVLEGRGAAGGAGTLSVGRRNA